MSDRPRALTAAGDRWAIATPHWAATEAGDEAFAAGGNAIDAALAAAVTLAVVYPHMCGVGGDLFALVERAGGPTAAVNASGAAPMAIDAEALRRSGTAMPPHGPFSITVPGAVSGWEALARLGASLPFDRAFGHAIRLAAEGVSVAHSVAATLAEHAGRLAQDPGMADVFFPGGRPLEEGALLMQPALAGTLEAVARDGPRTLYGGEVGSRLAPGLAAAGSLMTLDDLARHEAEHASALSGRYRDLLVSVAPPNSQGFVLLEILATVERLGLEPDPLGQDAAILAEVFRAAGADRDRHNADPGASDVAVATLLDESHIAALCDRVRKRRAAAGRPAGPSRGTGDTIALVAADAQGNAVSLIQSLFDGFGSGILEPSTGIV
ncbi:MAG: gamma-glutamyltransferase, partial [Actinomycetota bacterium]